MLITECPVQGFSSIFRYWDSYASLLSTRPGQPCEEERGRRNRIDGVSRGKLRDHKKIERTTLSASAAFAEAPKVHFFQILMEIGQPIIDNSLQPMNALYTPHVWIGSGLMSLASGICELSKTQNLTGAVARSVPLDLAKIDGKIGI